MTRAKDSEFTQTQQLTATIIQLEPPFNSETASCLDYDKAALALDSLIERLKPNTVLKYLHQTVLVTLAFD